MNYINDIIEMFKKFYDFIASALQQIFGSLIPTEKEENEEVAE